MRPKEITGSLPTAVPASPQPEVCPTRPLKPVGLKSPSLMSLNLQTFPLKANIFLCNDLSHARRLRATSPQHPVSSEPHQPLSQSSGASSGLLITPPALLEPFHSMCIPAEALSITCWEGPALSTLPCSCCLQPCAFQHIPREELWVSLHHAAIWFVSTIAPRSFPTVQAAWAISSQDHAQPFNISFLMAACCHSLLLSG